jgi:hypothetical protein
LLAADADVDDAAPSPLFAPPVPSPPDEAAPDAVSFVPDVVTGAVPSSALDDRALDGDAARRSFFAQPDPLKWMVGGANAFLIGPRPHDGHVVGGSAWTPWTTSKRVPQAAQS